MAVTKIWPVCSSASKAIDYVEDENKTTPESELEMERTLENEIIYSDLEDAIDYIENGEKTEEAKFVSGIGCTPEFAAVSFRETKDKYGKEGNLIREKTEDGQVLEKHVQAWHCVMSFEEGEVSPAQAHAIGCEFAERAWGDNYEVVVATHLNTENIHNHFIVNSVGYDGKLLHKNKSWLELRHITDELCKEYGLSVIDEPSRGGYNRNYQVHQANKENSGETTKISILRDVIDSAIAQSTSIEEFKECLKAEGCKFRVGPEYKHWSVTPPGYDKPVRLYHLGASYTNQGIEHQLNRNNELDQCGLFYREEPLQTNDVYVYQLSRVWEVRREWKVSYKALWQSVCELYGFTPRVPPQYNYQNYVPPWELQKSFIKMEKLNSQAIMLMANDINSQKDLNDYKSHCQDRMKSLETQRDFLRKKIRRAKTPEEKEAIKLQISELTRQMALFRKDLKMCHEIDERSNDIAPRMEEIDARMEELEKEKGFDRTEWDEPSYDDIDIDFDDEEIDWFDDEL